MSKVREAAAEAGRPNGVENRELKATVEAPLGTPNPGTANGMPLPASPRGSRVLEDAMWFAECRGAESCGVGDLFCAALVAVKPGLLGTSPYDCGGVTSGLLLQISEFFGDLDLSKSTEEKGAF